MRGSGLAFVAFALALPAPCDGLRGRARGEGADARPVSLGASAPAPTAPPVWSPPETAPPVVDPAPAADAPDASRPVGPEMKKAITAFEKGEHKKVRALLEKRVRAGKGTSDEAKLVASSCAALGDKACVDAMRPFARE